MIQQTSLIAYHTLTNINERQRQCFSTLSEIGVANNRQVSEKSNLPINVVTPRMGELRAKGLVEEAWVAPDDITGRKSIYWKIKE